MKPFKHLKRILIHKYWVFYYCCKAGLVWRGVKHDMSKFHPVEFLESIKYYDEKRTPIGIAKENQNGISYAWLHHKAHNTHHYEYWQDNFDSGTTHLQMPLKDATEAICDYLAACRIYNKGISNTNLFEVERDWWNNNRDKFKAMHPHTKMFINLMIDDLCSYGLLALKYDNPKRRYETAYHLLKNELH